MVRIQHEAPQNITEIRYRGVFQTLSTTYAAEVMPVALRAYLTSNVNMCWLIGQYAPSKSMADF